MGPLLQSARLLVAGMCGLVTAQALALGLAPMRVESRLHERLDAWIPLRGVPSDRVDRIEAEIDDPGAPRELLGPGHVRRGITIEARRSPEGRGLALHVRSEDPVTVPVLELPITVRLRGDARIARTYTALIDPPAVALAGAAGPADEARAADAGGRAEAPGEATPTPGNEPGRDARAGDVYGPVRPGETAWEIARELRPEGASIPQTMVALLRANPDAFAAGQLDRLQAGHRLLVPSPARVRAVARREAAALYRAQRRGPDASTVRAAGEADAAAGPGAGDERAPATPPASASATDSEGGEGRSGTGVGVIAEAHAAEDAEVAASRATSATPVPGGGDAPGAGPLARVRARLDEIRGMLVTLRERIGERPDPGGEALGAITARLERLESTVSAGFAEAEPARARETLPAGLGHLAAAFLGALAGGAGAYAGARRAGRSRPMPENEGGGAARAPADEAAESMAFDHPRGEAVDTAPTAGAAAAPREQAEPGEGIEHEVLGFHDGAETTDDDGSVTSALWNFIRSGEATADHHLYLLRVLHESGADEAFREVAEGGRAVLAQADGYWAEACRLGRELRPDDPLFAEEHADEEEAPAPAAGAAASGPLPDAEAASVAAAGDDPATPAADRSAAGDGADDEPAFELPDPDEAGADDAPPGVAGDDDGLTFELPGTGEAGTDDAAEGGDGADADLPPLDPDSLSDLIPLEEAPPEPQPGEDGDGNTRERD